MDTQAKTIGATRLVWSLVLGLGFTLLLLLWALMPHPSVEAQGDVHPGFTVDLAYDAVWGLVSPGDKVTVAHTSGGYGAAEADGAGFFWTPVWQSNGQPADLAGGGAVTIYVNGAVSATITPYAITGQMDVLNDRVVGAISGLGGGRPVTVTLGIWASQQSLVGAPQVTTTTNASGAFTATFPANDLGASNYARVEYAASPDTVQSYLYPSQVFEIDTYSYLFGHATPGQLVTMTVYVTQTSNVRWSGTTTANRPHGNYGAQNADIEPGDVVEVDLGGGVVITATAGYLTAHPDVALDQVTGDCPPGETVHVFARDWQLGIYAETTTTADASGHYTATFAGFDLKANHGVYPAFADAEGDDVLLSATPPRITARPEDDGAYGAGDGPNAPFTATLLHAASTYVVTGDTNPGNGTDWLDFGEEVAPGDVITLETATWSGVMTVADLSFSFDTAGDRILGDADIPGWLAVQVYQWNDWRYPVHGRMGVSTTVSSPFTATFPGFDLRDGCWTSVLHYDANDFATRVNRDVHHFEVNLRHNGVGGAPPSADEVVTATLSDAGGSPLDSISDDDDGDPWRYWLDLGGGGYSVEPSYWVTVTSASGWTAGMQVPTLTIEADENTDLVWGEGPKTLLFAEHASEDWSNWDGRFIPVDGYALDWSFFGRDVRHGDNLVATYQAPDGNRARQELQWPQMRVNYRDDWVGGDYEAGHTFWVTVTDGVASTAVLSTTPGGGWGGSGFETQDSDWSPGQPDIQPGDQVAFQSEDGYSNLISVGTITGNLDVGSDVISGTINAPWFGSLTMTVRCEVWHGPNPPIEIQGVNASGGSYECDFGGLVDIQPGWEVAVMYIEPDDGDRVINVFREPVPNLGLNKWSQGQPAGGGNFVYEIEYWNGGEAEATNVVLTDTLPLSTTYVADSSGVPAHVNGRVITWSLATIPAQSSNRRFQLVVAVDPLASGTLHNEVEIYTPYDEWTGDNSASTDDDVQSPDVDLRVEKWNHHSNPAPGYDFVYYIEYNNDGGSGSGIVTLADTLPISTSYVSWFSRDPLWNLVSVGSQVVFTRPVIAGNDGDDLYLTLHLSDTVQEGDTLTNVVSIATTNETGDLGNNVYTHTMGAQGPYLDVGVSKDFGQGTTVAGYDVTYYINYMNHSNTPAYGVLVTDTLPANTTFVTSTIQVWQYGDWQQEPFTPASVSSDRVVWDLGTLDVAEDGDSGEYGQIYVTLHISSGVSAGTVLTNAVEIASTGASPESDDNPENDSDEAAITVRSAGANLMVLKHGNWQGGPPWRLEYDLQFYNVGTTRIESFTISDTYPLSTTLDWGDVWWGDQITFTDDYTDNQAIWEVGNPINAGDSGGGRLVVNVDPNVGRGRILTNVIEIAGTQAEVETSDNVYTLVKTTGPDLYVVKTAPSPWVEPGETLTFTLRYGNQAERGVDRTDESGTVYLTDTLPAGMEYVTSTMRWCDGPDCPYVTPNIVGDDLVFDVGWQGDGWWNEIYLTVQVTDTALGGDSFPNQVEIASSNPVSDVEPYASNNADTATLTLYDPLFAVGKTYEGDVAGKVVTYTLTVTNSGPEAGTNVLLSDALPANLTYGGSDGVWTGTAITWSLSVAANDGTATGWFTATLPITDGLTITNDTYYVVSSDQGVSSPMGAAVSFEVQPDREYVYLPLVMRNYQ